MVPTRLEGMENDASALGMALAVGFRPDLRGWKTSGTCSRTPTNIIVPTRLEGMENSK